MKLLKLALLVGGLMLLSSTSFAQAPWRTGPSIVGAASDDSLCTRGVTPGASCYWAMNGATNTTDSPVIVVSAEYATVNFTANVAGTDVGNSIVVFKVIAAACNSSATASENTASSLVFRHSIVANTWNESLTGVDTNNLSIGMTLLYTGCYFISPVGSADEDGIVMLTGSPLVGR